MRVASLSSLLRNFAPLACLVAATRLTAGSLGLGSDYDILVEKNFSLNGAHIHGSSAVGNNVVLSGNMSEFGNNFSGPGPALVVGGQVILGADARINGTKTANLDSLASGQSVVSQGLSGGSRMLYATQVNVAPVTLDFDGAFADLRLLSLTMAALDSTVNVASLTSGDAQNKQLNLGFNPGAGFEVLDLTVAEFMAFKNIQVGAATANTKSWIINVNLTGYNGSTITQNRNGNDAAASQILWNFFGAETLSIANQFYGTVFAPDLAFTHTSNDLKGQVIAESFTKTYGQVHVHRYTGDVPEVPGVPDTASTFSLLAAGAALMFAARRRW